MQRLLVTLSFTTVFGVSSVALADVPNEPPPATDDDKQADDKADDKQADDKQADDKQADDKQADDKQADDKKSGGCTVTGSEDALLGLAALAMLLTGAALRRRS